MILIYILIIGNNVTIFFIGYGPFVYLCLLEKCLKELFSVVGDDLSSLFSCHCHWVSTLESCTPFGYETTEKRESCCLRFGRQSWQMKRGHQMAGEKCCQGKDSLSQWNPDPYTACLGTVVQGVWWVVISTVNSCLLPMPWLLPWHCGAECDCQL